MAISAYEDVICITSRRKDGIDRWWWEVRGTDEVLYATFETSNPSRKLREQAVISAFTSSTKAVAVTSNGNISETEWVSPVESPFSAPPYLQIVQRNDLELLEKIQLGVDVVEYEGSKYIHKYMISGRPRLSFELEIQNYEKTALDGCQFVPNLFGVVVHRGENRGLLIEYIPSTSLHDVPLTIPKRYLATKLIWEAIIDLESRGYYPQDLKCNNILFDGNEHLHIIDLGGGITWGMYRQEAEWDILQGRMESRDMLFTLGKTIWQLWYEDTENDDEDQLFIKLISPPEESLPPLIQKMVQECCSGELGRALNVVDAWKRYQAPLEQILREV